MRLHPLAVVLALCAGGMGCAARAQAPVPEPELPVLAPPPAPPRIVATYAEPEAPVPVEAPPLAEPSVPVRPQPKPVPPPPAPEPVANNEEPPPAPRPPALTLSPVPGTEAKTEASIRAMLSRVSRDLSRVNAPSLTADGRTQFDAARRFVEQSEEALKARNLVYAGKLADKASAMAAVLVR
jgi:outer membrane biosynthesis protein TonB